MTRHLIKVLFIFTVVLLCYSCTEIDRETTVYVIPVYGQSLALGEEAPLVTDFDSLTSNYDNRIRTENMDGNFGYFSNTILKQKLKSIIHDRHRTFEVSCYGLGEYLVSHSKDKNSIICTFPEGQGATGIDYLVKGSKPYNKLIDELKNIQEITADNNCHFIVPAFCWLQGENDVTWNTGQNYKEKLSKFREDLENDIKAINHQKDSVFCVLYQTNAISLSKAKFSANNYNCEQTRVPQEQMELVRDSMMFIGSGPTYPYNVMREYVHIDGIGQKSLGYLEGMAVNSILQNKKHKVLYPTGISYGKDTVIISFCVPNPPLHFDTINVRAIKDYGFSVINKQNQNITDSVFIRNDKVYILCSQNPQNCKVRYAVNGTIMKSGNKNGPRGNLRDSQGDTENCIIKNQSHKLYNWCYMFDMKLNGK